MEFERDYSSRNGMSKASSEPHGDSQRNYSYCLDLLNKIEILNGSLYWQIYEFRNEGYDKEGNPIKITTEPKYIFFSWEEPGRDLTGNVGFHQPHDTFKKEMTSSINFLIQRRFVKRIGNLTGFSKMNRMKNSLDSLFSN
jgi:hypothetical protein